MIWILAIFFGFAGGQSTSEFEQIRQRLVSGPALIFKTQKEVETLVRTRNFEGRLTVSKGRIHWLTEKPYKALQLFDGKSFYSVQYPISKGEKAQVIRAKSIQTKNSLLALFQNQHPIEDFFKIEHVEGDSKRKVFRLTPKDSKILVSEFIVTVDSQRKIISQVQFTDDAESKTRIHLQPVDSKMPVSDSLFQFVKPEGARVVDQ